MVSRPGPCRGDCVELYVRSRAWAPWGGSCSLACSDSRCLSAFWSPRLLLLSEGGTRAPPFPLSRLAYGHQLTNGSASCGLCVCLDCQRMRVCVDRDWAGYPILGLLLRTHVRPWYVVSFQECSMGSGQGSEPCVPPRGNLASRAPRGSAWAHFLRRVACWSRPHSWSCTSFAVGAACAFLTFRIPHS